ncbi:MAG: alpha/beta hydrolase [Brevundimonas sp.]|uniref:alpha/beta hydrolase n=1 Tax=Brevundimonas sp. TaxID=1871086 RepID=UPI002736C0A7|nr:alpha/beta hydrolase [Brevundimonas sp.]MDP3403466.1 alpha/beta hydrolase [Brevundimonas sp.]
MLSPIDEVIARVQAVYGGWGRQVTVQKMRDDWDGLFGSDAPRAPVRTDTLQGVPVAWVAGEGADARRVFIYLHGGGYQVGSIASHADLVARISAASGMTGLIIDYRRAPEHRFPAPIDDVLAVWMALATRGFDVADIPMVGDSAGGNLALASAIALRERAEPLPRALVLLSPWTDLEARGASYETRAAADPIHQRKMILNMAGAYLNGADAADRLASPLNADMAGMPPMLIQVGDRETVLSDSEDLAAVARQAGVPVELQVWPGMIHVFQQFPDVLAEAREAVEAIGAFLSPAHESSEEKI